MANSPTTYEAISKKSGKTYYLHSFISPRGHTMYFFAADIRDSACALPDGYEVAENPRTGLPMLRKSK